MAINLAMLLGSTRIILLGYDHKIGKEGQGNWHVNNIDGPKESVFFKFRNGFKIIKTELDTEFPMVEVLNAGPDSDLDVFEKIDLKDVLS